MLLTPPPLCSDDEAETLAGKFPGTELELKAATIGELQSPSCPDTDGRLRNLGRMVNSRDAVVRHTSKWRAIHTLFCVAEGV